MKYAYLKQLLWAGVLVFGMARSVAATEQACQATDTACLLPALTEMTGSIEEQAWRDHTYREIAKLLIAEHKTDEALALIPLIKTPDTRAMTIRGIGMEAAKHEWKKAEYDDLFARLRTQADTIEHPPSFAIALTYIAMAQAFAGDDAGAMKTAASMENSALRNKAYGESSEIQAEHGDLQAAMASIAAIDDLAYRNKAYKQICKIFADRQMYDKALTAAENIENHYQKAQSILYILARQITPEEVSVE